MDIKNISTGLAACLLISIFSCTAQADTSRLPFPKFPASIPDAEYSGKKGCVAINDKTPLLLSAIAKNEKLMTVGALSFMRTPKDGAHAINIEYNPSLDYAYIMANKSEGALCVIEKLNKLTFQSIGNYQAINVVKSTKYTANECGFTDRYGQICGTFKKVSGALEKNGFSIDWQGVKANGNILTLLSGNGKSYYLTTDNATGATVVTGTGKHEFKFVNAPRSD